ncbi:hypothetical protein H6P81_018070 [Aristolochia fimbriata]|uniref:Pentatricopeptide repeat-containing protein n=1 Tax=Aristolochia fimbriata TaxID=158543 RepID=A0AAV7E353_ARIFI|nr:hypothetical protein H6P81_018070 [Aristolochia fimbriata]
MESCCVHVESVRTSSTTTQKREKLGNDFTILSSYLRAHRKKDGAYPNNYTQEKCAAVESDFHKKNLQHSKEATDLPPILDEVFGHNHGGFERGMGEGWSRRSHQYTPSSEAKVDALSEQLVASSAKIDALSTQARMQEQLQTQLQEHMQRFIAMMKTPLVAFDSSFSQATEWMFSKDVYQITPSEHALRLDLVGKVHGSESAETYFNDLEEKDKNEKTHGALLNCYARDKLTDKILFHMKMMKKSGFASTTVPYDNLMYLYSNIGQYEKVPEVLAEMKINQIVPCNFSYRICINFYSERSDIEGME